jgi:ABC-type branched-subunit amino acid transport system substrate-binding protein
MTKFTHRVLAVTAALVLVALAAWGGSSARSGTAANLKLTIGNLLELTGPGSFLGPPTQKAGNVATTAINRATKKGGVPLSVATVSADTQGDPQAALLAARSLIDKGASCLVGPASTPETIAVANALTIQQNITVWPEASSTAVSKINDNDTVFRATPDTPKEAIAAANAVQSVLGSAKGKTVSIAAFRQPFGTDLANFFKTVWESRGGKVQGPVIYDTNQVSFDSEAQKVVANDPDAYWLVQDPTTFSRFAPALLRTGKFDAKKLFLPSLMAFPTVPDNIPAQAVDGAHGVSPAASTTTQSYKAFDALWNQAGGVAHQATDVSVLDSYTVCALAAAAAHSNKAADIKAKVRAVAGPPGKRYNFAQLADAFKAAWAGKDINYEGLSSNLDFNATGDPGSSLYQIYSFAGGKLVNGPYTTAKQR